ncbi:octopine dehydrogenase-like [Mytilus californianus]|uniref:octopine dehydrogenase-like n=1 Tax=Mytilus californianus TaxID=6549 RepID=UPI0022483B46|nr:octopine dehydrogenase-like [Mytilus californianus]
MKILICGGGNGAHCFTALASACQNVEVNVLTIYKDEAERWTDALKSSELIVSISKPDGSVTETHSKPSLVTKDPQVAVDGVQIIFIVVPAYVHQFYLQVLSPYIKPNTLIVGLPGHAGFELQCLHMLHSESRKCAIVGFESLPWACRIIEYGKRVQLLGFKDILHASFLLGTNCNLQFPAIETIQSILGPKPSIKVAANVLAVALMTGSIMHPPIMYGKWKNWDKTPLDVKPLFYQGVDEEQANIATNLSDEVVKTAKQIQEKCPDLDMSDVVHLSDWFKAHYQDGIADNSSLMMSMRTNRAYEGLEHPMKALDNGYVPDFAYRYTTEDVPFGLVVLKGLAVIAGVATPTMDKIIQWAQSIMGKEYIIGTDLVGKDVKFSRAPQSFGLNTLEQVQAFINSHICVNA